MRRDGRGYTIHALEKDRETGPRDVQPDNTVEIAGTGLGLTVLSRACLERMLARYGDPLGWMRRQHRADQRRRGCVILRRRLGRRERLRLNLADGSPAASNGEPDSAASCVSSSANVSQSPDGGCDETMANAVCGGDILQMTCLCRGACSFYTCQRNNKQIGMVAYDCSTCETFGASWTACGFPAP